MAPASGLWHVGSSLPQPQDTPMGGTRPKKAQSLLEHSVPLPSSFSTFLEPSLGSISSGWKHLLIIFRGLHWGPASSQQVLSDYENLSLALEEKFHEMNAQRNECPLGKTIILGNI